MSAAASLLLFGDEQISFAGIPRCALPPPLADPPADAAGFSHCPGQLCLDHAQLLLADADPEPLQPSLIPAPPPWEAGEGSRIRPPEDPHHAGERRPPASDPAARTQQLGLFARPGVSGRKR